MQNLSSVSMLCKLKYCFTLLNCNNLLLGGMPSHAFFLSGTYSCEQSNCEYRQRQRKSLHSYRLWCSSSPNWPCEHSKSTILLKIYSARNLVAMFSLLLMRWLRASLMVFKSALLAHFCIWWSVSVFSLVSGFYCVTCGKWKFGFKWVFISGMV